MCLIIKAKDTFVTYDHPDHDVLIFGTKRMYLSISGLVPPYTGGGAYKVTYIKDFGIEFFMEPQYQDVDIHFWADEITTTRLLGLHISPLLAHPRLSYGAMYNAIREGPDTIIRYILDHIRNMLITQGATSEDPSYFIVMMLPKHLEMIGHIDITVSRYYVPDPSLIDVKELTQEIVHYGYSKLFWDMHDFVNALMVYDRKVISLKHTLDDVRWVDVLVHPSFVRIIEDLLNKLQKQWIVVKQQYRIV